MLPSDRERTFEYNLSLVSPSSRRSILSLLQERASSLGGSRSDLEIIPSRHQELPVLKWRGKNLHSQFDPLREADRRVEGVTANRYTSVVYLGVDLLYSLDRLEFPEHKASVILIFLDRDFLFTVLQARELHCLKRFSRVEAVCLEEGTRLVEILQILTPACLVLSNEILYREADDLKRIRKLIEEHTRMLMSAFFTQYYFEKRWMKNLIRNWSSSPRSSSFSALRGRFQGQRAILVGAGISLTEHIAWLQKMSCQGKESWFPYSLWAVDTALPTLLANGLNPDGVIALDGGYPNSLDFARMPGPDTLLVTYPHLYSSVVRDFPGPVVYFFFRPEGEGLCDPLLSAWQERIGEKEEVITRTGNVSAVAAEILAAMGFEEIVLTGIDFVFPFFHAHVPDGMHHHHYLKHHNRFRNLETFEFEEIYHRMTEEDKVHFQNQDDGGVTTLLADHAFREFRQRIREAGGIRWRCCPSDFSRLMDEVPVMEFPEGNTDPGLADKNVPVKRSRFALPPMMGKEELISFLGDAEQAVSAVQECLGEYRDTHDRDTLEKTLSRWGWNFSSMYLTVSKLSSGNPETVIREMGNTLTMMKTAIQALLRRSG